MDIVMDINQIWEHLKVAEALDKLNATINAGIKQYVANMMSAGAIAGLKEAKISTDIWNVTNPEVSKYLEEYTLKLTGEITATTEEAIKNTLKEGIEAGDNPVELKKRVEQAEGWTDEGIKNRAETVARTESLNATESGKEAGWKQAGDAVKGKSWSLSPHACSVCVAAADIFNSAERKLDDVPQEFMKGSTIVGADGKTLKLDWKDISHPPLHPQCRCTLKVVLNDVI